MSVETWKKTGQSFGVDLRQRGVLGSGEGHGASPAVHMLLSRDRLLPHYTFPTEGDTFLPSGPE